MDVVVCVKYVPNPQGTPDLGPDHLVIREGVEGALDPGDEFAVEAALRLVEAHGGEVRVVSMGPEIAMSAIRRAFAMGAHTGVLVTDPALRGADALATSRVLAAAIRRSPFDLVLTGVESTDGSTGTVAATVAELLGLPAATFARSLEVADGLLRAERQTEDGLAAAPGRGRGVARNVSAPRSLGCRWSALRVRDGRHRRGPVDVRRRRAAPPPLEQQILVGPVGARRE
jgi:electron transfer flavoprotein beta subunit